jgi:hypothetical protein
VDWWTVAVIEPRLHLAPILIQQIAVPHRPRPRIRRCRRRRAFADYRRTTGTPRPRNAMRISTVAACASRRNSSGGWWGRNHPPLDFAIASSHIVLRHVVVARIHGRLAPGRPDTIDSPFSFFMRRIPRRGSLACRKTIPFSPITCPAMNSPNSSIKRHGRSSGGVRWELVRGLGRRPARFLPGDGRAWRAHGRLEWKSVMGAYHDHKQKLSARQMKARLTQAARRGDHGAAARGGAPPASRRRG